MRFRCFLFWLLLSMTPLGVAQQLPTLIFTCNQLMNINDPYGTYVLAKDIDCNNEPFKPIDIVFSGVLDGQNHTISNLNLQPIGHPSLGVGLFREIVGVSHDQSALVKNIHFDHVTVQGTRYLGLLAGRAYSLIALNLTANDVTIESDDNAKQDPYDTYHRGGLIGDARHSAFIDVILRNVKIETGVGPAGGLVGQALDGNWVNVSINGIQLHNPISQQSVQSPDSIGGVAGLLKADDTILLMDHVHVSNMTVDLLQHKTTNIGGIAGQLIGLNDAVFLDRISAKGKIKLREGHAVGGLFGSASMHAMITDSFTRVNIQNSDGDYVGGLIGATAKSPDNVIFLTRIYVAGEIDTSGTHAGRAVIGSHDQYQQTVISMNSFYDKQVTGKKYPGDTQTYGKKTKNMKSPQIYSDWSSRIWILKEGEYPELNDKSTDQF